MVLPLGPLAFWLYGFAFEWGDWADRPGRAAWQATFGPLDSTLDRGLGLVPAPGHPANFRYPLLGSEALPVRRGCQSRGVVLLDDGSVWNCRRHSHGSAGRAVAVEELLPLWALGGAALLDRGQLDLRGGGILAKAGSNWGLGHSSRRFRRFGRDSCHRRHDRPGRLPVARAAHRQIPQRPGRPLFRPSSPHGDPGHALSVVRLAGVQCGLGMAGGNVRVGMVAVNTLLAAAAGASAAMAYLIAQGHEARPHA